MTVNFQVPFIPQTSITEQILAALTQGFREREAEKESAQRQQQLDQSGQNIQSEISLRGAQQQEIEEEIRHKKMLAQMFSPQPSDQPAQPGQPARSWWDSHIESTDLPDEIKKNLKVTGQIVGRTGAYNMAWNSLEHAMTTFGKKVRPGIVQQSGQPVAVTDEHGLAWDINDPQLPDNLKPIAKNALDAYSNKAPASEEEREFARAVKEGTYKNTSADRMRFHQAWQVKPVQPGTTDARLDRSFQYNAGRLDKMSEPIDQLSARLGRLIDSVDIRSPQADALIAPELLTVMAGGMGSGLRMNEAEISRIVGGRSQWETLQAKLNKWAADPKEALSVTEPQREQIRSLARTVADKIHAKQAILAEAQDELNGSNSVQEHRRIVSGVRQKLAAIDRGEKPAGGEGEPQIPAGARAVRQGGKVIGYTFDGKNMIPLGGQ